MRIYLIKRLASAALTVVFVSFFAFVLINIIPSDPAEVALRVSDTIAVLRDRQKIGEILGDDADEQKVFRMIAGVES